VADPAHAVDSDDYRHFTRGSMPGNSRGTVGDIDRDVVAVFKKPGFAWGGDWGGEWRYTDPMNFELSEVKRVG